MVAYANRGGDSNVVSYEIGPGRIIVSFSDGSAYLYTDQSTGPDHIACMHRLARAGEGLGSFITRSVGKNYASKLR